ncbi:MAG: substrate-binding domain-containing protein [Polyangiaceae bacterium]
MGIYRSNIGVFVDAVDPDYQQGILLGIHDEAQALDLDVTCFVGGILDGPESESDCNVTYALCHPARVDALIVLSGTLSNYAGMSRVSALCERFRDVPICSIGGALPGAFELAVDNRAGVRQALTHLAQTCGRRRIAFVRGPEGNDEARERFAVYQQVVRELGLASDAELVVDGDFLEPSGARAVKTLLDDRRQGFDALVAASDLMAMGAMRELIERKVAIPQRVAVVGFDDIEAARFATPALSTVRQPLYEQGQRALREVVARIAERGLPDHVSLDATFIPRESCGARSLTSMVNGLVAQVPDADNAQPLPFDEAYRQALPHILRDVRRVLEEAGFECDPGLPETLLVQASTDIQGRSRGLLQGQSFVSFLEGVISSMTVTPAVDFSAWQEVISVMRRHLAWCLRREVKWRRAAEDIWHRARSSVSHLAERIQARKWLAEAALRRELHQSGHDLLNARDVRELASVLASTLERLKVRACFVAIPDGAERYRGLFSISDARIGTEFTSSFASERLLPEELVRDAPTATTWLVQPLIVRHRLVGYVVFAFGPAQGRSYAMLRDYLSAAVGDVAGVTAA